MSRNESNDLFLRPVAVVFTHGVLNESAVAAVAGDDCRYARIAGNG
jgi:hypothetical protein